MIPNQWYAILPSTAVRAGRITAVRRLGIELALFRDRNGQPGCVTDRCSHRGAALSAGKVTGDCLQCPFHGLEFETDGRCRFVPANGKASTESLERFNVQSFPVREEHGILYIWYGDGTPDMADVPFFPEHIGPDDVFSEIADPWHSHYSRCIENQLDVVHLPFVHHNTIGRGNRTLVNGPKVEFLDGRLRTSARNEADIGQTPKKPEACDIGPDIYLVFRYPNVWLNHISDKIKVMIYFAPVDEENTVLYIRFYCTVSKFRPLNRFIAWTGKFANRAIERQDKRVVITQQPKASSLRGGEKLLMGDGPIVTYRRMREAFKEQAGRKDGDA